MHCNRVQLLLVEHVLPHLRDPAVDWSAVAGHIEGCPTCREECEQRRQAICLFEAAMARHPLCVATARSGAGGSADALAAALARRQGRWRATEDWPSDVALIRRVIEDDRPAFGTIYLRYRQGIVNAIAHRWPEIDYHAAEDVVNEAFLQVWRNRYLLAKVTHLQAYLRGTAQNVAAGRFRGRRREQQQLPGDVVWPGPSASTALERAEMAEQVRKAVACLARSHRIALELSQVGLSAREIASQCGCSEKAAERRLEKSRERLKSSLSHCGSSCAIQTDRPEACPARQGRAHCLKWLYMHRRLAAHRRKQDQQVEASGRT